MASNTAQLPEINYSARDFALVKEALSEYVKTTAPEYWTDFFESNLGVALIDLLAYVADQFHYYLNKRVNNLYMDTVETYGAILRLCKLIGYIPDRPRAANLLVEATGIGDLTAPGSLTILAGEFILVDGLTFENITTKVFPQGSQDISFSLKEGKTYQDIFGSDGSSFQAFTTSEGSVIEESYTVKVNDVLWTEVAALIQGGQTSVYAVEFTEDGNMKIRFGDGITGLIPPSGATIKIDYRSGGGVVGNVAAGSVSTQINGYVNSTLVRIPITNSSRAEGGEDAESLEHIRVFAPRFVKTTGRAITKADFDTLASAFTSENYGAVGRAVTVLRSSGYEANIVDVYIWERDDDGSYILPSVGLKTELQEYLNSAEVGMITVVTYVNSGVSVPVNINLGTIKVDTAFNLTEVSAAIDTAIDTIFQNIEPGETLAPMDIWKAVVAVPGIVLFALVSPITNTTALPQQLLVKGTITKTVEHIS